MAILIKLFAIRIVANSLRGASFNKRILFVTEEFSEVIFSRSFIVSEKKATSELEINAEHPSKKTTKKIAKYTPDGAAKSGVKRKKI
jgi:hypothetical protein